MHRAAAAARATGPPGLSARRWPGRSPTTASTTARSTPRGSSIRWTSPSAPGHGPSTVVGRRVASHCGHGVVPAPANSHDGTPVRAKVVHDLRMAADSAKASSPPPEKPWTIGLLTVPKTNGISSAWHDPRTPPKAGDSQVNR